MSCLSLYVYVCVYVCLSVHRHLYLCLCLCALIISLLLFRLFCHVFIFHTFSITFFSVHPNMCLLVFLFCFFLFLPPVPFLSTIFSLSLFHCLPHPASFVLISSIPLSSFPWFLHPRSTSSSPPSSSPRLHLLLVFCVVVSLSPPPSSVLRSCILVSLVLFSLSPPSFVLVSSSLCDFAEWHPGSGCHPLPPPQHGARPLHQRGAAAH